MQGLHWLHIMDTNGDLVQCDPNTAPHPRPEYDLGAQHIQGAAWKRHLAEFGWYKYYPTRTELGLPGPATDVAFANHPVQWIGEAFLELPCLRRRSLSFKPTACASCSEVTEGKAKVGDLLPAAIP